MGAQFGSWDGFMGDVCVFTHTHLVFPTVIIFFSKNIENVTTLKKQLQWNPHMLTNIHTLTNSETTNKQHLITSLFMGALNRTHYPNLSQNVLIFSRPFMHWIILEWFPRGTPGLRTPLLSSPLLS